MYVIIITYSEYLDGTFVLKLGKIKNCEIKMTKRTHTKKGSALLTLKINFL